MTRRKHGVRGEDDARGAASGLGKFRSFSGSDAIAASSRPIIITDATLPDNPIVYANAAFSELCGYDADEVIGRNCRFLQGRDTDQGVRAEIRAAIAGGANIRRELLNYRKDGTAFWNDLTIDPIRDGSGRLTGFIGIQTCADAAHLADERRVEAESRLANIAAHVPGYIYQRILRADGTIELAYCSPSIGKLLGMEGVDIAPIFYALVHPDDRDGLIAAIRSSAADMSLFREEFRLVASDGSTHWLRSDAPPRRTANGEIVWDGLAIEISAEKRWESEIASLALRDPLTGLLSRAAWLQALARRLKPDSGETGRAALLCIDINALRDLNDRLGQPLGDEILREIARRLAKVAESVRGVSARLGADEFAVLAPACADEDALARIARETADLLGRPMAIGEQSVVVSSNIGATIDRPIDDGPLPDDPASELMTQAELALRWAKQGGRGPVLYSRAQDDRFQNPALLAHSLGHAVHNDELTLHFQPLVDLASGAIVSAEALLRWTHPTLGMQRPDLFIPLAEKSGLIVKLGHWVFEHVLQQRRMWQDAGLRPPPIAINVSGVQLLDPGFLHSVQDSLEKFGARAADFEIELTEGLLIEPSPQIIETLLALRAMGFTITIDDFGSGHASFRYLRDFPVDKLKIDQIFVRKLVLGSTDALIIRAIISLARGMGIALVAEGVETEMQRKFLQAEGCLVGQGYLFSVPLVAEDFARLLAPDVSLPIAAARARRDR